MGILGVTMGILGVTMGILRRFEQSPRKHRFRHRQNRSCVEGTAHTIPSEDGPGTVI